MSESLTRKNLQYRGRFRLRSSDADAFNTISFGSGAVAVDGDGKIMCVAGHEHRDRAGTCEIPALSATDPNHAIGDVPTAWVGDWFDPTYGARAAYDGNPNLHGLQWYRGGWCSTLNHSYNANHRNLPFLNTLGQGGFYIGTPATGSNDTGASTISLRPPGMTDATYAMPYMRDMRSQGQSGGLATPHPAWSADVGDPDLVGGRFGYTIHQRNSHGEYFDGYFLPTDEQIAGGERQMQAMRLLHHPLTLGGKWHASRYWAAWLLYENGQHDVRSAGGEIADLACDERTIIYAGRRARPGATWYINGVEDSRRVTTNGDNWLVACKGDQSTQGGWQSQNGWESFITMVDPADVARVYRGEIAPPDVPVTDAFSLSDYLGDHAPCSHGVVGLDIHQPTRTVYMATRDYTTPQSALMIHVFTIVDDPAKVAKPISGTLSDTWYASSPDPVPTPDIVGDGTTPQPEPETPTMPDPIPGPQIDGSIIIDTNSAVIKGDWTHSTFDPGHIGPDYLHDGNTGKGSKSVTYSASGLSGSHAVYAWWTAGSNRASNTLFEVNHSEGTFSTRVDQRENDGVWVNLGTFNFDDNASVTIRNDGTDGYVVADAIRLVPVDPPTDPVDDPPADDLAALTARMTDLEESIAALMELVAAVGDDAIESQAAAADALKGSATANARARENETHINELRDRIDALEATNAMMREALK